MMYDQEEECEEKKDEVSMVTKHEHELHLQFILNMISIYHISIYKFYV